MTRYLYVLKDWQGLETGECYPDEESALQGLKGRTWLHWEKVKRPHDEPRTIEEVLDDMDRDGL